jgi:hypothetical protein
VLAIGDLCRVLIVDDEILIRQGIKHYINWEQEGFLIAGEAGFDRGHEAAHHSDGYCHAHYGWGRTDEDGQGTVS